MEQVNYFGVKTRMFAFQVCILFVCLSGFQLSATFPRVQRTTSCKSLLVHVPVAQCIHNAACSLRPASVLITGRRRPAQLIQSKCD